MNDPFVLEPELWFGVLCHGVGTDPVGRINFQSVFNQVAYRVPPAETGIQPHAHLQAILAVGFTGGEGRFEAEIELRDVDNRTLWHRQDKWVFDVGLGQRPSAFLALEINQWLSEPGRYHYWIRLTPGSAEHRIPFEVAERIGPAEVVGQKPAEEEPPQ